jgi:hypothetical protein
MRRALVLAVGLGAAAIPVAPALGRAAPAPPRVEVMVVGRHGVALAPRTVVARPVRIAAGRHRCRVRAATALAVLAAARRAGGPAFRVRDYGACGPGGLFVTKIGRAANRGLDGWDYKVEERVPGVGAGARSGIRSGSRVLWFWCRTGRLGGCQLTLAVTPGRRTVAPGQPEPVLVRGYDNSGRGRPVAGATVRLGGASARTDAGGHATLAAPSRRGAYRLSASRAGLVTSFPERVVVR